MVAEGSWIGRVPLRVQPMRGAGPSLHVPGRVWLDWLDCSEYEVIPSEEREEEGQSTRVVQIRKQVIAWDESTESVRSSDGCLLDYLSLKGESAERILEFAKEWGCLSTAPIVWEQDGRQLYAEPVEVWQRHTHHLYAIIRLAACAEERKWPEGRIYSMLDDGKDEPLMEYAGSREVQTAEGPQVEILTREWTSEGDFDEVEAANLREIVSGYVTEEMLGSHVQSVLAWEGDSPPSIQIGMDPRWESWREDWDLVRQRQPEQVWSWVSYPESRPSTLRAALAIQVAAALTYDAMVAICSQCDNIFLPERRPRPDKGRYCSDDCRQEAHRQVLRESYRRRKERRATK